jgi:exonuclease SbcD
MRILHTSDWHIGRTFHRHSTLGHLSIVFDALVSTVKTSHIDVVVVAGDVFDSALPSVDSVALLSHVLRSIREAGAVVIMTSGNHDSAIRLGFQSEWASLAGIHIITAHDGYLPPVTVVDAHGPVNFYGIPYLEPSLIRHHYPELRLATHEQVLDAAMDRVRADIVERPGRSVAISHCFVADIAVAAESSDVERDISAGGLNLVPAATFAGCDYVALGHIHGRATIAPNIRYSGAPLHYSFAEAGKPRGGWIVTLGEAAVDSVEWIDLPIPRRLTVLTGTLDSLLTDSAFTEFEADWVSAILTDQVRPLDGMRLLQERYPNAVALEHRPTIVAERTAATYSERVLQRSDREIVGGFLEHVRNGVGASAFEGALLDELLTHKATA